MRGRGGEGRIVQQRQHSGAEAGIPEALVVGLENEGVEYIFGIPGEENIDVMDALLDSKIKFITTRHEQGAAFMADVYGRLTGRAGPASGAERVSSGASGACD